MLVNIVFTMLWLAITMYALAFVRFAVERSGGAVPAPIQLEDKGMSAEEKQRSRTQYEHQKYLDAVSPRTTAALVGIKSATGFSIDDYNADEAALLVSPAFNSKMLRTPPKTLIVKDLWYTIPINGEPIDFLKGVTFFAEPGRLCALMGSSGAGKTTLMDVISGRKTVGNARGEILINGEPKVQHEFVKYTGYVEQFGVHSNSATIRESLEFSAKLR